MDTVDSQPDAAGHTSRRGQATRAEIIAIAKRLFSEHGYHHTGLSDIQDATGLTKGAFYHHFGSKEELALAVLESTRCEYADRLFGPAMARPTPRDRIIALLDGVLELNANPQWSNCQMMATLCAELTTETGRIREVVQQMQRGMIMYWRDLIAAAQKAGQIDPSLDATLWAQWIVHTFIGLVLARKLETAQVPAAQVIEQLKRLLFKTTPTAPDRSAGVRRPDRPSQERNRES